MASCWESALPWMRTTGDKGEYGGWFCLCHGSHYDTSEESEKDQHQQIWKFKI